MHMCACVTVCICVFQGEERHGRKEEKRQKKKSRRKRRTEVFSYMI